MESNQVIGTFLSLAAATLLASSDSTSYVVLNHGRNAGDMTVVSAGDSTVVRWIFVDRNRGTRLETRYRYGPGKQLASADMRQIAVNGVAGPPNQSLVIRGDSAFWPLSAAGGGTPRTARFDAGTFVGISTFLPFDEAALASFLLKQPRMTARVLPNDSARAEIAGEATVPSGKGKQHVRLVMIYSGTQSTPSGVWIDDNGAFFSSDVEWFITIRPNSEAALPIMRAIEIKYRNAQAEAIAMKVVGSHGGTLFIKNGDVFDSETGVMLPNTNVVIRDDRIVSVGPAATLAAPAGATIIDAAGKTVMPGMWEMHTHLQLSSQSQGSLIQLAQGLTTVRDLASDFDVATSQRDRERKGVLASPRVVLAGFMEGPGRWAGPTDVIVKTEDEAMAAIARYDSAGYKQLKLYNIIQQDLVPAISAEAKKRGLRLSGHIPRGLSVPAAVQLGYDEIQHAAFLFSTFYQDSLYVPTMRAYSAVATAVAPNIDVDGAPMTELIRFLHDHHTVIDGTFSVWIGGSAALVGAGGSTNQQKADAAYLHLIKRLYDGDVTLVPGTDNTFATTYHRELELYEQAGIPAPRVLQIATIGSARVMHEERDYGSIVAGKVADIIIVAGKPATQVKDLEKVETVIRAGRVYDVKGLSQAVWGGK
jgi:imidazolonepropionase-like amidohydrolase